MFLLGKFRQDLADVVNETHVQHTVRFIQYKVLDLVEANEPLLHEGPANDQVWRPGCRRLFSVPVLAEPAKRRQRSPHDAVRCHHTLQTFTDLQSQFTRWCKHQRMYVGILCRMILGVQQLEDQQGESCRLPVPVCAQPKTSCPFKMCGMDCS